MLNTVMRVFTQDIQNFDVQRDALQDLIFSDCSLLKVYTVTEEFRRVKVEYICLQKEVV